jgi:hypothetical protein
MTDVTGTGATAEQFAKQRRQSPRDTVEPIRVRPYPLARTFDTIEAAVAHAMSHPRLPEARRDAARLKDSVFVDACWTLSEWVIRFDCDLSLCVWVEHADVRWALRPSSTVLVGEEFQRVGSAPVMLDWGGTGGLSEMDCSALVAKRRGARFKDLFFNEFGLFVYLRGHLILQLSPVERVADGRGILYILEDD